MPRRALITGGAGFVGQWLARALVERGWTVAAAGLAAPTEPRPILTEEERLAVRWLHADFTRSEDVEAAVAASEPDVVFHLAGVSYVPQAQGAPVEAYDVNVLGAVRLLDALVRRRRAGTLDPIVLVVGSGIQYGRHDASDMPLVETAEQRPVSIYGATKAAQEMAALQVGRADRLRVICTRSFNHSGAGHAPQFLLPALVRRALALRARGGSLPIGNADSVRDYLHVADVVRAYLLLVERGRPGEVYNVCSGEGVAAGTLAADVLQRVGAAADISIDPELVRGNDVPALVGSPAKLVRDTGWTPTRTRADIIDDLIRSLHATKD